MNLLVFLHIHIFSKPSERKKEIGSLKTQPCFAEWTRKYIYIQTPFWSGCFKHHCCLFPGSSTASEICITAETLAQQRARALFMPQQLHQAPHKDTCPSETGSERIHRVRHGSTKGMIWQYLFKVESLSKHLIDFRNPPSSWGYLMNPLVSFVTLSPAFFLSYMPMKSFITAD